MNEDKMMNNTFWKKIEKLYTIVDDDFGKEEIAQYNAGTLVVSQSDVKEFFFGGVIPFMFILAFDIIVLIMHFMG